MAITIKRSLIGKIRSAAEQKYRERENSVKIIDRSDRKWSTEFIGSIACDERGKENIRAFLRERKSFASTLEECPYQIITYEEINRSDPSQTICGENELILSNSWAGREEEIQVLTYEELENIVMEVIN